MFAARPFNKILRLAFGASLGLLLAKLTNSDQWGVFFTISPVLLLGLIPRLTPFVVLQYLSANLLAGAMVLLYSWLGALSAVMTLLVFIYFLWLFNLMAKGAFFVYAAIAIKNGSIFLHFASYPSMDPGQMLETGVTSTFFPHGLGHPIGLQVHDVAGFTDEDGKVIPRPDGHPFLRMTRVLEPGMVVTIEPGLYFIPTLLSKLKARPEGKAVNWDKVEQLLPWGGVRIEDEVHCTDGVPENLTRDAFAAV